MSWQFVSFCSIMEKGNLPMFIWKKWKKWPFVQKYQNNLCNKIATVCVRFQLTTKYLQHIHLEWEQLNPRYVGPLRLNLAHFTPGRESFPGAALSPHRGSSPTSPTHTIPGWAQPAGLSVPDLQTSTDISWGKHITSG